MKKLLVISDTHGNSKGVAELLPLIAENDFVIHLGDGAGDMRDIYEAYPEKIYSCAGNCDFFSPLPEDGVLEIEYLKIYYCHGHKFGVKSELSKLAEAAKAKGADIVLYGHTHKALISEVDGVTMINPGTLRYSIGKGGSYCYLVIHKDKATPVIVGERYLEG